MSSAPEGRPVGLAAALADSVSALDSVFRVLRETINREALSIGAADRRSATYAARYDSLERSATIAEGVRSRRDRVRARLGRQFPTIAPPRPTFPSRAVLDSAARATGRAARRAPIRPEISLRLPLGTWWIAALDRAGVPTAVRAGIVVGEAGATAKLGAP